MVIEAVFNFNRVVKILPRLLINNCLARLRTLFSVYNVVNGPARSARLTAEITFFLQSVRSPRQSSLIYPASFDGIHFIRLVSLCL